MKHTRVFALAGALALAGCDAPGFAPEWNVDLFFPIRYPDVELATEVGPVLPSVSVAFTTPVETQDLEDTTGEILSEDLEAINVEVIFSTTTPVQGVMEISVAASPAALFSNNTAQALNVTLPLRVTEGDTVRVTGNPDLFSNATTLFYQTRGTVSSSTGGIVALDAGDVLSIGVDLFATIRAVK